MLSRGRLQSGHHSIVYAIASDFAPADRAYQEKQLGLPVEARADPRIAGQSRFAEKPPCANPGGHDAMRGGETDMTDANDRSEQGLRIFGELLGEGARRQLEAAVTEGQFGTPANRFAIDFCFGEVWNRDGLTRAQRSLVTLGMLIALGQPAEFRNHVKIGITNGLTLSEIEEVLAHAVAYVGFPRVASATRAAIEALRELGLAPGARTMEERGLL
jgi:4-carboxymuconolactone decarboxylase